MLRDALFPRQVEHVNGGGGEVKRDLSRKRRRVRADREVENANPGRSSRGVVLDTQRGRILFSVSTSGESTGGRRYDVSEVLGEGDVDLRQTLKKAPAGSSPLGVDPAVSSAIGDREDESRAGNKDSLTDVAVDPGRLSTAPGKAVSSASSSARKMVPRHIEKDVGEDRVVFRLDGIELVGVGELEVRMWRFLVE